MSPKLFITVLEFAFQTLHCEGKRLNIGGRNLTILYFAVDIVLSADNIKDIKKILQFSHNHTCELKRRNIYIYRNYIRKYI